MFQVKWTKKALHSFADTLKYWNIHNSSEKYSRKLRIEVEKKEKIPFPKSSHWFAIRNRGSKVCLN